MVVFILGMHRSGTSCLTGCLEEQGLFLGSVNNAARHNLKGNKENIDFRQCNDLVLSENGGTWSDPPTKRIAWSNHTATLRDRLISTYDNHAIWGFKDPRSLLTLPFWLEALPDMQLTGSFRHPTRVARSLMKRNNFNEQKSLDLWAKYNRHLLEYAKNSELPLVNFDWPADSYRGYIIQIARYLELSSINEVTFYDTSLQASKIAVSDNSGLPDYVSRTYQELCDLADERRSSLIV
jgi:hypothetical protein